VPTSNGKEVCLVVTILNLYFFQNIA